MKRFFSRLSTGPASPPLQSKRGTEGSAVGLASPSEKAIDQGEKVRALAARFEGLSTGTGGTEAQQKAGEERKGLDRHVRSPGTGPERLARGTTPATPPLSEGAEAVAVALDQDRTPTAGRLLRRSSNSSLQSDGSVSPTEGKRLGPTGAGSKESKRDASGGSHSSGGNPPSVVKSVAWAPSPKKQRPPSPPARPSPKTSLQSSSAPDPEIANFARPTVASSARARSQSTRNQQAVEASTSVAGGYSSATEAGSTSRSASAGPSAPRVMRTNSAHSRRSSAAGLGNNDGWAGSSAMHIPGTHNSDIAAGLSNLPNSIPFATGSNLRSASPQSFGSGGSSFFAGGSHPRRRSSSAGISLGTAGWASTGARGVGGPSWTEMTEVDLVNNLGPRERTRQEVLWEIVASEERYVAELEKTKELYIDALLHPLRFSPRASPSPAAGYNASEGGGHRSRHSYSTNNSSAELPIAARFMNASQTGLGTEVELAAEVNGKSIASSNPPSQIRRAGTTTPSKTNASASSANGPSRPPSFARDSISKSLARDSTSTNGDVSSSARRWSSQKRSSSGPVSNALLTSNARRHAANMDAASLQVPLPAPIRAVLEALSEGLLEGHALLSDALKARYEEQWPLVRSLADVFLRYSYILKHYAAYVCHLERALEQLEEAALMERAMRGKRIKKERLTQTVGLGRAVAALEAIANERGDCGLAIFLSKPFQRLLKYPLLFQNLLFHTDPSTHEFESTVGMVVEVERIVRTIEDQKVSTEERDKTRDAFARIEGILDRQVLKPRSDRFLIEEKALYDENPRRSVSESAPQHEPPRPGSANGDTNHAAGAAELSTTANPGSGAAALSAGGSANKTTPFSLRASIKSKRSYRRLSDFLSTDDKSSKAPNMGSKNDIWIVRFSDVELKCQRVGVTALPMASSTAIHPPGSATINLDGIAEPREPQEAPVEDALTPEQDFASRAKDSKERLKALRNTTLRAKTRNLYKFIAVTSWRATSKTYASAAAAAAAAASAAEDRLEGLSTSHEVDEEDEEDDDDDTDTSDDGDDNVLSTEKYIRQNKLSFSYWGNDKVEPRVSHNTSSLSVASQGSSPAAYRASLMMSSSPASAASTSPAKRADHLPPGLLRPEPKRASTSEQMQAAVTNSHAKTRVDKFANRMRVPEQQNDVPLHHPQPSLARRHVSRHSAATSSSALDVRGDGVNAGARPSSTERAPSRTLSHRSRTNGAASPAFLPAGLVEPHPDAGAFGVEQLAAPMHGSVPEKAPWR